MSHWQHRHTPAHTTFRTARDLLLTHRTDHDTAYASFRWPRPTHFNWALEWFDVIAADNPDPALVLLDAAGGGSTVSFAELSAASDALAAHLRDHGVARGDRVLLVLDQRRELWETLLACLKLGAVVIPTYTSLTPAEAADRLARAAVAHVVCEPRLTGLFPPGGTLRTRHTPAREPGWLDLREARRRPAAFEPDGPTPADDVAFCYFTSGTTSAPKLVAHTHTSYPVGHLSGLYWQGLLPGDRHLNVSAPGWAKHSWSSLFVPWNAEAAIVALPPGPTRADTLPALLARHAVTTFCAPPSTWRALHPYLATARPALREALSAGEPLDRAVSDAVQLEWGVRVRDGYGQTETTGLIGTTPGLPSRPGRLGKPLPGYRITLVDPATGVAGDRGELCVELDDAPAGLMRGYLAADGSLRAPGPDRWATGDVGERDPDGYLRIEGRSDDVFKSFDRRISPYELETVLRTHPAVTDAAVVPLPHPVGGAVPHAVVEARSDRPDLATDLLAHVAARVAPELRVHSIEVREQLPRTASGKVRRAALAAELKELR
ncbi:AMP-binding protein [Kitasatospora sp. NPDC004531]